PCKTVVLLRKNVQTWLRIGDRRPVHIVDLHNPPSSHERISLCWRLTIEGYHDCKQPEKCNSDHSAHWRLLLQRLSARKHTISLLEHSLRESSAPKPRLRVKGLLSFRSILGWLPPICQLR